MNEFNRLRGTIVSHPLFLAWALVASASIGARGQSTDPPADYYTTATGTGATLKAQLHSIISRDYYNPASGSTGHRVVSYSNLPSAFAITDLDPNNSADIILLYTGQSVSKVYDSQALPWNREHTWPNSLGPHDGGPDYSDLHHLFPCDTDVNNSRGNLPYGLGSGYWDPNHGGQDRGDVARAMFYMATRYTGFRADGTTVEPSTMTLTIVNGQPGDGQMGDLAKLLQWNYQDPPSTFEKTRNEKIFNKNLNPTYYQGNRNPYIDHPEYVWTIFGGGNNNSQLTLSGATSGADGSSSLSINLGRVIKGGTIGGLSNVTLNKGGSNPTTYNITLAGNATSSAASVGNTFDYNAQSRTFSVGLNASTTTTGLKTGTLTIDNSDLSTGGAGLGSADANDTVNISAAVVDNRVINSTLVDFGRVIGNKLYDSTTTLSTSGADTNFTRVTVGSAAATGADGVFVDAAASGQLFDDPTDTATRGVHARFTSPGLKGGVVPLAVSGEGLLGEAVNSASVSYSAQLMEGTEQSPLPPGFDAQLSVDFGTVMPFTTQSRSFPIEQWLAKAGLDIDASELASLSLIGDSSKVFSMNLDALASGDASQLLASLDTAFGGIYDAEYVLSFTGGQTLEIDLRASVVPEPSLLALSTIAATVIVMYRRRDQAA